MDLRDLALIYVKKFTNHHLQHRSKHKKQNT